MYGGSGGRGGPAPRRHPPRAPAGRGARWGGVGQGRAGLAGARPAASVPAPARRRLEQRAGGRSAAARGRLRPASPRPAPPGEHRGAGPQPFREQRSRIQSPGCRGRGAALAPGTHRELPRPRLVAVCAGVKSLKRAIYALPYTDNF